MFFARVVVCMYYTRTLVGGHVTGELLKLAMGIRNALGEKNGRNSSSDSIESFHHFCLCMFHMRSGFAVGI
jgi:hypothetical protein